MTVRAITYKFAQAFTAFGLIWALAATPNVATTSSTASEQSPEAVPTLLRASNAQVQVAMVATGGNHTCAVTSTGAAKCWGFNSWGQLGDGKTPTRRKLPVDVISLASGVETMAAGANHTCALTSTGAVKCWGENDHAELGDGTLIQRTTPVGVSGLSSGVMALTARRNHSCALTGSGGVKCWGDNEYGELGDGSTISQTVPVDVVGLASGVSMLTAGGNHTCAVSNVGGVKCWGYNLFGQLGDGTTINRSTPVNVSGLTSGVVALTAGDSHTCAVTSAGAVKCWGWNGVGQLGDGTTTNRSTPVDVSGLTSNVTGVAAGYWHTCAVTSLGGVKCWGNNLFGELGTGMTGSRSNTPVDVSGLTSGIVTLAAGERHTCAKTSTAGLKCWGTGGWGQLGNDAYENSNIPVNVLWPQSLYLPLIE